MKVRKGITLIELIIVLAVIVIIGAILVPNFLSTTDKARLKSDIQSARVLSNALELYNAEQTVKIKSTLIADIIKELSDKGYIDQKQVLIQTEAASWALDASGSLIVVDISKCSAAVRDNVYDQLSDQEKRYVRG